VSVFAHAGFRPMWPVILFLPWLLLGVAYLITGVVRSASGIYRRRAGGNFRSQPVGEVVPVAERQAPVSGRRRVPGGGWSSSNPALSVRGSRPARQPRIPLHSRRVGPYRL
jgi:hypothetical protein